MNRRTHSVTRDTNLVTSPRIHNRPTPYCTLTRKLRTDQRRDRSTPHYYPLFLLKDNWFSLMPKRTHPPPPNPKCTVAPKRRWPTRTVFPPPDLYIVKAKTPAPNAHPSMPSDSLKEASVEPTNETLMPNDVSQLLARRTPERASRRPRTYMPIGTPKPEFDEFGPWKQSSIRLE